MLLWIQNNNNLNLSPTTQIEKNKKQKTLLIVNYGRKNTYMFAMTSALHQCEIHIDFMKIKI